VSIAAGLLVVYVGLLLLLRVVSFGEIGYLRDLLVRRMA